MADDKVEGVTTSETASFVAQRRAVTQTPGQDEALEAASAGKVAPETKTQPDPGPAIMEKLDALAGRVETLQKFNEELKKDNYKLREKVRRTRPAEEEEVEEREEAPAVDAEAQFAKFEERIMKKIAPVVHTVRALDFGSRIAAIAAGNPDVASAIMSLPPEVQANLADRVERLAERMGEESGDPTTAAVDAIFYLAGRHGRQPASEGVTLPDTKGRPATEAESEDRKINRALFGEQFVPKGRPKY
jgi:hypothetical protein